MALKIGKYEVTLREKLGWYDQEVIKNEMISGAKMDSTGFKGFDGGAMLRMKIKLWELAIAEIKDGENVIPFSEDWVKELSGEEGTNLEKEIDKLSEKK